MLLPIVAAVFLGAWGLSPSLQPQPAQGVEKQNQPTQQNASAEPSINEQKTKSDQRAGEKEHDQGRVEQIMRFVREYNAEIVAISTAIMGLFTVALFVATWLLYWGAEKHSERELRAYVFVSGIETRNFRPMAHAEADAVIKNSGQTPAYKVRVERTFDINRLPRTQFDHRPGQGLDMSESTVGPAGGKIMVGRPSSEPVPQNLYDAILSGACAPFLFGQITYVDAFGKNRYTNFRYIGRLTSRGVEWESMAEGNQSN